ncbi:MAG: helix-turn-helix transcriptional regulator [Rhodoferax sp.]|nr:helix-turn-helix transcriptional regulator [Rhodoferax sp.]
MPYNIADIVRHTGITIDELAYLCGVSRTTASKWVNKRSTPHVLIAKKVHSVLRTLSIAHINNVLPLRHNSERIKVKDALLHLDGKRRRQPAYVRRDLLAAVGM